MKKLSKINIIHVAIAIILSLLTISTLILIYYGKNQKEITILLNDPNKVFQISSINIGGTNFELKEYENNDLKYNEEYNFLESNIGYSKFNIKTSLLKNVSITFIKNKDNGKINIIEKENNKTSQKTIDTGSNTIEFINYTNGTTVKSILYNSLTNLNTTDLILLILFFAILTIIDYFVLKFLKKLLQKMSEKTLDIKETILFILFIFLIFLSSIYILLEIFNVILLAIIVIFMIILFKKYPNIFKNTANIFLIFATVTGLSILFIHPPFNVPDEASHFYKAYQIANFMKVSNKSTTKPTIEVPKNVAETINNYTANLHSIDYKLSAKSILADLNNNFNDTEVKKSVGFGNVISLPALCYIPASVVIFICQFLNGPILLSAIIARCINLLIFIIVTYKCIQFIPKFKNTLLIVGLLPITLSQAAGINQDGFTNTIFIFLLSYIFKLIYEKTKINFKSILPVYIGAILLAFCKLTYFPILFLLLLIPKESYSNKKHKYIVTASIILLNIVITLLNIQTIKTSSLGDVSPFYTFSTIINHPIHTIIIFFNTIFERLQLDMLCGVVNGFGWSTKWGINLFVFIIQTVFLLLFITANTQESVEKVINKKLRWTFMLIAILIFGFIYGSLLLLNTQVTDVMITGLQSRYFIPVILLFIICITNNKIIINTKNKSFYYFISFLISLSVTLITLINGFYI